LRKITKNIPKQDHIVYKELCALQHVSYRNAFSSCFCQKADVPNISFLSADASVRQRNT